MAHCFISYRRTPSSAVATALQSKLESKHHIDAYVDTTRADGTRVQFPERLMAAIDESAVFVCLLGERDGEHTLESGWVLKEIQRAYDLQKFCIPVFQESYRPLGEVPPAVEYLLGFDGVHILDQKNIMIDESVRRLADLVHPHVKKLHLPGTAWVFLVAMMMMLLMGGFVLLTQSQSEWLDEASSTLTSALTVQATYTPGLTRTISLTPTSTPTPLEPSATRTPTMTATELSLELIVATLDAVSTQEQIATQDALESQAVADQTATAAQWTTTPTPNMTASVEAFLTERANTATQTWVDSWTPTPTFTPSQTLSFTATPTATATPIIEGRINPSELNVLTATVRINASGSAPAIGNIWVGASVLVVGKLPGNDQKLRNWYIIQLKDDQGNLIDSVQPQPPYDQENIPNYGFIWSERVFIAGHNYYSLPVAEMSLAFQ